MNKKKILNIIFSILLITFKIIFFIPVHKTGGFANIDTFVWINILEYNFNDVSCADCFNYQILWSNLFFELVVTIIIIIMVNFIFKAKKKKKLKRLVISIIILLILFFPIKTQYWDGGTTEYRSLTYRIIKWNRIKNYGRIKNNTEIIVFPNNFHNIEYYDQDIEPPMIKVLTKENNPKSIECSQATYQWSKKVGTKTLSIVVDTIDPIEFDYKNKFIIENTEKIYLENISNIQEITIRNLNDLENSYQINYDKAKKEFNFNNLNPGEYVVVFKYIEGNNYSYYSFKVEIVTDTKIIENIIDTSIGTDQVFAAALEEIYEDSQYTYYLGYIKSYAIIVTYINGEKENIKEALANGNITIKDLDLYDIGYIKEPKNM